MFLKTRSPCVGGPVLLPSGVDTIRHRQTYELKAGETAVMTFAVPVKVERETVDGIEYTTTWIGNQLIEVVPRGNVSPLPF